MTGKLLNGTWWWAYLDDLGVVRILPYTDDKIIAHTESLAFCRGIFEPFKAPSLHMAHKIIAAFLTAEAKEEAKKNSFTQQFMDGN